MSSSVGTSMVDEITIFLKFIFSWLMLMAIAVIITGKLLSKPINYGTDTKQVLKIPLKIFNIEANGGEVILGFACMLVMLLIVAVFGGVQVYEMVKTNFGFDPGHFYAICFFSSLLSVAIASIFFVSHLIIKNKGTPSFVEDPEEYKKRIQDLANKGKNNGK